MGKKKGKAGLIPFHKTDDGFKMMFMMPSNEAYGGKVFQIAKGGIDDGENSFQAAIREASEELGLRESNIKWVEKCGLFLNTHHIYVAEVGSADQKDFNDTTYETEKIQWMTAEEFFNEGRRLHRPIVDACINLFKQKLSEI
jgi:8-oxo-dGTP pyrophosphatase MutT (NUDIX family)